MVQQSAEEEVANMEWMMKFLSFNRNGWDPYSEKELK